MAILYGWLDSAQPDTLTLDENGKVIEWRDPRSFRTFTAPEITARPEMLDGAPYFPAGKVLISPDTFVFGLAATEGVVVFVVAEFQSMPVSTDSRYLWGEAANIVATTGNGTTYTIHRFRPDLRPFVRVDSNALIDGERSIGLAATPGETQLFVTRDEPAGDRARLILGRQNGASPPMPNAAPYPPGFSNGLPRIYSAAEIVNAERVSIGGLWRDGEPDPDLQTRFACDAIIREWKVFGGNMTRQEVFREEYELMDKWGMLHKLPAGHPYTQGQTLSGNVTVLNLPSPVTVRGSLAGTGEFVFNVPADNDGNWSAFVPPGDYLITYLADGCAPITHGPYSIIVE